MRWPVTWVCRARSAHTSIACNPRVRRNAPALRDGDIIIGFNGHEIGYFTELPYFVGQYRPGTRAEVVVRREGEEYTFEVTLGSSPTNAAVAAAGTTPRAPRPQSENPLGFRVADLSDETRQVSGISGVRVAQMAPGPGSDSGLQLNDVITALNGAPVESVGEFARIAEALPDSGSIPLEILRQGESRSLSLELP